MLLGPYRISLHDHGTFRLDGGAMFGAVPKALWERWIAPDEKNRIPMATRSLIVDHEESGRRLLVDVGCGDKYTEKTREIFALSEGPYRPVEGVTDVLLTHLHFDHAGGVSSRDGEALVPNYPGAVHYVSRANLENARRPNVRERASYLAENVDALDQVETRLLEDGQEVWPGIVATQAHGHTSGLQWVLLEGEFGGLAFPSDLIPTAHHLPAHYTMGYDLCAETAMREKADFLARAAARDWMLVFQHDPAVAMGRVELDASGRPTLREAAASV